MTLAAPRLAGPGEDRGDEFAAAPDAELVERSSQVLLHGVGRDVQFLDDLPSGVPLVTRATTRDCPSVRP
jgi:hypothetical protein